MNMNKKILIVGMIILVCGFLVSAFSITGYQVEGGEETEEEQLQSLCSNGVFNPDFFSEGEIGVLISNGFDCSEGDIRVSDVSGVSFKENSVYFGGGLGEGFKVVTGDIERKIFKGKLGIKNPFSEKPDFLKPEKEIQMNVRNISKEDDDGIIYVWDENYKEISINDLGGHSFEPKEVWDEDKLAEFTQNKDQENELKITSKKTDFSSVEDLEDEETKNDLIKRYGDDAKNYNVLTSKEAGSYLKINDNEFSNLEEDSKFVVDPESGEIVEIIGAKFTEKSTIKTPYLDVEASEDTVLDFNLRANDKNPANYYIIEGGSIKDIQPPEIGQVQIHGTNTAFPDNEHYFTGRIFVQDNPTIYEGESELYYGIPRNEGALIKNQGIINVDNHENPKDTALFFQNTNLDNRKDNPFTSSVEMFTYDGNSRVDAYVVEGGTAPKIRLPKAEERINDKTVMVQPKSVRKLNEEGKNFLNRFVKENSKEKLINAYEIQVGDSKYIDKLSKEDIAREILKKGKDFKETYTSLLPGQVSVTERPYDYSLTSEFQKNILDVRTPVESHSSQGDTNFVFNNAGKVLEIEEGRIERRNFWEEPEGQGLTYREKYLEGFLSEEEYENHVIGELKEVIRRSKISGNAEPQYKIDKKTGEVSLRKSKGAAYYTVGGEVLNYNFQTKKYSDMDDFVSKEIENKKYADYNGYPAKVGNFVGHAYLEKNEQGVYEVPNNAFSHPGGKKVSSSKGEKDQASVTFDTPDVPKDYSIIESGSFKKDYVNTLALIEGGDKKEENALYRQNFKDLYYIKDKRIERDIADAVESQYNYNREEAIENAVNLIKNENKRRMSYDEAVNYLERTSFKDFVESKDYLTKEQFIRYQKEKYAGSSYKPDFDYQWESAQSYGSGFNRLVEGVGLTTIGTEEGEKPTGIYVGGRRITYEKFFNELDKAGITLTVD